MKILSEKLNKPKKKNKIKISSFFYKTVKQEYYSVY